MKYLLLQDFRLFIQESLLQQLTGGDLSLLDTDEDYAIEKVKSKLSQKYDLSKELTPTQAWSNTATYNAGDRVYDTTGTLYNANYPVPPFDLLSVYKTGDQVFYKNKTYTAVAPSGVLDSTSLLQYGFYGNIPFINILPDDPAGATQWGVGRTYQVEAATALTDTNFWTKGDSRNPTLKKIIISVVLRQIYTRVSPRNIPEERTKDYHEAMEDLKLLKTGDDSTGLPVIQIRQGGRIRYGGNIKNNNEY